MGNDVPAAHIRLKRAYDPAAPEDGKRVLVDRLWPRGVSKEKAALDEWAKALAPSTELRKWFGHDPDRWTEFAERYALELQTQQAAVSELRELAKEHTVTLIYAARDQEHNEAVVLRNVLLGRPPL